MATVLLLGTLDTKREEYVWLRDRLAEAGCEALVVDAGVFSDGAGIADVGPAEVAAAGGAELARLREEHDRGASMGAMAAGAAKVARSLYNEGRIHGVLAVGRSAGPPDELPSRR